ncbi:K+/H+ antiporter [Eikenella longinqua]|uniref:K+/H+ antiporter n=1 Tax=Eikenella longinqua TaxID=1795827 RepID=A0A1A9S282_9NEIS|nr:potassium/proton antiporter [Eikenella longinqua]OAM31275.1 K+/H+ antiporter [Eikenella longinqua]
MEQFNTLFLIMASLLFVSVVATRMSARLGMPLLLVFLGVGMLAGEEGIGGIRFNNYTAAALVGQLALAIILLDGGLRTQMSTVRIALKPASVLATAGVAGSVLLLGLFATFFLGIDWKLGFLMAAIVGSTDAAAVFSLLRNSGVRLNSRVSATLELESGLNDPMAILLVTALTGLIAQPEQSGLWQVLIMLVQQLGLGVIFGLAAGKLLAFILKRIRLAEGLYALMIASGGLMLFAVSNMFGGSGFLAVYLAGLLIGNSRNNATEHVLNVMDGLAWLAQAALFLVLGLLVSPSRLLDHGWQALAIGAFLMLVARPLAVWLSIRWFRYAKRELIYISWVGLRGAVPVTLALMPLMMGVQGSMLLFDVTFAVVILSLLVQGTTIPVAARRLDVVIPPAPEPQASRELWLTRTLPVLMQSFAVEAGSDAENSHPYAMTRSADFSGSRFFALVRDGEMLQTNMSTRMQAGDVVWYVLPEDKGEEFAEQFAGNVPGRQQFYGEFVVRPDARADELAQAYGLQTKPEEAGLQLVSLFRQRFGDVPVAGDRINIGGIEITVKELDEHSHIKWLGLKIPRSAEAG